MFHFFQTWLDFIVTFLVLFIFWISISTWINSCMIFHLWRQDKSTCVCWTQAYTTWGGRLCESYKGVIHTRQSSPIWTCVGDHTYGLTNIIGSSMVNFSKLPWLKNGVHKGLYCDRKLMKIQWEHKLWSNFEMYDRLSFIQWSNCR